MTDYDLSRLSNAHGAVARFDRQAAGRGASATQPPLLSILLIATVAAYIVLIATVAIFVFLGLTGALPGWAGSDRPSGQDRTTPPALLHSEQSLLCKPPDGLYPTC